MRLLHRRKQLLMPFLLAMFSATVHGEDHDKSLTYRHFATEEADGRVLSMTPVPDKSAPRWERDASQQHFDWTTQPSEKPFFARPIPFVLPPTDEGETFYPHNHQPSITWLPNGDPPHQQSIALSIPISLRRATSCGIATSWIARTEAIARASI